jgi:(2Fe-2S) ferredoxin
LDEAEIVGSGCLGCCGNGPMVRVLPDETWYSHVTLRHVEAIAAQHLEDGIPVTALLDRQHHDPAQQEGTTAARSLVWAYVALGLAVLGAIGAIGWTLWAV